MPKPDLAFLRRAHVVTDCALVSVSWLGAYWVRYALSGPLRNPINPFDNYLAALPLIVRSRRPGDRIQPVGLGGTKTLQDLMVDRKVPRDERHRIPLVVDASGRIVWVVGLAVAAHAAASAHDDVVVLTFEQPAVSGSEAS